ncbi:Na(+)/H(+) antiporter subunit B [Halomonas campisalis]|uniref:Na(+)/H(+) antiporter subunit B n=1 Tax=Billgrantia campisalis TaxID=74661 RepID=A0ABS9P7C0_9GAMM|nr:Na(+)/H(+) antiporter subunit B [Halomonas campisalis]MCG6657680.1 Na(+)/H(+) antiporter subunit B [Halomonas campisalis]MDR5862548.1 Na(+)/H(+) antiporter subunit B [Halomonas campisalis]
MKHHIVLRIITKIMIPLIVIYALYIQFHGEYSPGGGFQAGVIFSAGFIIFSLIFGLDVAQDAIPPEVARFLAAFGVLLYIGIGLACIALGGQFLEYKVLLANDQAGETLGIIGIELGVGITVAAVALTLFYAFAGREQQ